MTPDPRTERIRRYVDACKVNRIEVHVAPADLVYLLGRIEALEGVVTAADDVRFTVAVEKLVRDTDPAILALCASLQHLDGDR